MTSPYGLLAIKSRGISSLVPLAGVRADADILGRGARVKVFQRFTNPETEAVEAVYRFPLPEGAAVCGFRALIGERVMEGRVEERERAFEIYDDAMIRGHGAYLLDEERPNVFTVSVGNIQPQCEVVVEIEYIALLDASDCSVRFSLPTTISPRYVPGSMKDDGPIPVDARVHPPYAAEVPYGLSLNLKIHNGKSVESIESPSHSIRVANLKGDLVTVEFSSGEVMMDRDFILSIQYEKRFQSRAYAHRREDETFLQLDLHLDAREMGGPPSSKEPKEVIFVVDCSGSMSGDSIEQAKRAVAIALKALPSHVFFNICRFGSTFDFLFKTSQKYSEKTLSRGLAFLEKTGADLGGTEILAPLQRICSTRGKHAGRQRDIVLLTDGQVGNERDIFELLQDRGENLRIFAVGIGAGCNEYFVKGLARVSGGASEFIFPGERIEPKVLSLFQNVNQLGLAGTAIDWGLPDVQQTPSSPVIFFGHPTTVLARSNSVAPLPEILTLKGLVNGQSMSWTIPIEEAPGETLPIALLWARERIRDLEEDSERVGRRGSRQTRKQTELRERTLVELSRRFGLISSLTSFIAVEEREEKDRTTGEVVLREVPSLVTIGWHGIGSVWGMGRVRGLHEFSAYDVCRRAAPSQMMPEQPKPLFETSFGVSFMKVSLSPPQSERTNDVLYLLSLQKADGGIELDDKAARILRFDLDEIRRWAERMEVASDLNRFKLLSTAVVLSALEKRFEAERPCWEPTLWKSRNWLRKVILENDPRIGGMKLMEWVDVWLSKW